ncbi:hypothetical protein XHV734_0522 [Xanthomonas hortorum pv. vitians]|nr:hypothetical protein XHV734_0522 [Xanthomonas hortorum pv. vitians]
MSSRVARSKGISLARGKRFSTCPVSATTNAPPLRPPAASGCSAVPEKPWRPDGSRQNVDAALLRKRRPSRMVAASSAANNGVQAPARSGWCLHLA